MRLRAGLLIAVLAAYTSAWVSAAAQSVAPTPPVELTEDRGPQPISMTAPETFELEEAPNSAISIEHEDMIIEGELVSVRARKIDDTARWFNLTDIAATLDSRIELHDTLLGYHRLQDGTLMTINMADGKVRSNKTVLGKLPGFEPRETADPWIDINAVTILTGTHASQDDKGRTVLKLDERLKPQFGLELWVDGVPIDVFENEPRTVGPVLLVPLKPIVEALGHDLTVANGTVTVRRQQDQASINLELATGLISVNTTPRGITPDMQLAERDTLVLPFGAVEALTGTHVKLVPMTNRVEVTLDTRLTSTALPGARVADEARETPFTLESLTYQINDRGPLRAELAGHVSQYNFRAQLESAGGLENLAAQQPGWASVDIAALEGWNATLGDYTPAFRELSGVSASRIRGASWRKQQANGAILAIAAGVPLTGAKQDSEQIAVPEFGGVAAGVRLIAQDQSQDVGIAAAMSDDGDNASVVANGQKSFFFDERDTGLQSAFISGDLGAFSGDASGVDVRFRGAASYAINRQTGLSASIYHEGEKFFAGADRPSFEGVFDQRNGAHTNLTLGANWRADQRIGMLNRLGLSSRASVRYKGGDDANTSSSLSIAANAQIGDFGPTVSVVAQRSLEQGDTNEQVASQSVRVRCVQRFERGTLTASYAYSDTERDTATQQFVATAQANPIRKGFSKGALIQIAPNATLNWDGAKTRFNAGVSAIANAGRILGPKLDLQARFSAFSDFSTETESADRTRYLGGLEARYQLTSNAVLSAIYTDDFAGRSDLSIGLRGAVSFNPPRASRLPDEGKGVLNGQVFLDRNRDGVRQADEPGVPGVRVMLIGTRLGLNTTREGYFTIQNIKQGLYAVTVSRQSLPLGYLVPENAQPRVTVGGGRRTDVDIPLILSGQVRGTVFIDDNANGEVDPGEQRLEGQWISLQQDGEGAARTLHSASFGQYGFESVDPGNYTLKTTVSGQPVTQKFTIDGEAPFVVVPIPIPPDLAHHGGGIDLSAGVLGEP
ncbi:MAG: SdrD B-like domain-containing protein [Pseudomonadota bacterium]